MCVKKAVPGGLKEREIDINKIRWIEIKKKLLV